jgi:hypothetical protein
MSTSRDTAEKFPNQPRNKPGEKLSGRQLDRVSGGGSEPAGATPKLGEGEEARLRKAE